LFITRAPEDRAESSGSIGLFYVYLGNDGFGVVDWRNN
jgi:hypothetical protein